MGQNTGRYRIDPRDLAGAPELPRDAALAALLTRARARAADTDAQALQLGITPAYARSLSRGIVGPAGPNIEVIIRAADIAGDDPVTALRACGHPWLADRIDALRGAR